MKCYTSTVAGLTRGIHVRQDENHRLFLLLGEVGRNRRAEVIQFSSEARPRPFPTEHAEVFRVMDAHVVDGKLTVPQGSTSALVRVKTSAVPRAYTHGGWEVLEGSPTVLVEGLGAHGLMGHSGSWKDGLITLALGDSLRVQPEGQADPYILRHTEVGLEQVPV